MRKDQKIRVVEYVHVGDQVVEMSELTAEQRREVDAWIVREWMNGLYLGRAVFSAPGAEAAAQS